MKTMIRCAALLAALLTVSAQEECVARVRAWRAQHEPQILRELFDLVQHGANENLRIKNLWEGIDSMAALLVLK